MRSAVVAPRRAARPSAHRPRWWRWEATAAPRRAAAGSTGRSRLLRGLDRRDVVVLGAVVVLAALARVLPMLRGGGLAGLGNYDDGVHLATAIALTYGELPYRDYLFLHPPGITVALLPFAALGRLAGDPVALASARVAWMILGVVNALLIWRLIRPYGRFGAAVGAFVYAVYLPAAYTESTALLVPLGTVLLLGSLLTGRLLRPGHRAGPAAGTRRLLVAGALAGLTVTVKIWGVVPVLVLAGWLLIRLGRRAGAFLLAAVAAPAALFVPFFAAAPAAMWHQVVVDQLGRQPVPYEVALRLADLVGVLRPSRWRDPLPVAEVSAAGPAVSGVLTLVLGVALLTLLVAALRRPYGRVVVGLLAAQLAVLAVSPSWFQHYAAWPAPLLAAACGLGAQQLVRRVPVLVGVVVAVVVVGMSAQTLADVRGAPFDGPAVQRVLAVRPGCVTSDDPTTLILSGALSRNLAAGCRVEIDLSGRSYDRGTPEWGNVDRFTNLAWQAYALSYLRSGSSTILVRLDNPANFSIDTRAEIRSWPVVARVGGRAVRAPGGVDPG